MIRKTLVTCLILSSYLFTQPCFSMWCCLEEEEKKPLVGIPVVSTTPTAIMEIETQRLHHVPQAQESEIQQITQGNIIISCPKNLINSLATEKKGEFCTAIVCKNIINIQIFAIYDEGLKNNAFKQIHVQGVRPPNADSLTRKMTRFSDGVTAKIKQANPEDLPLANQLMQLIQIQVVEKTPHDKVKFGQDEATQRSGVIFEINGGALFLED